MYLVFLGAPGTGKGTQAKRIAARLGLAHIASGDMFREAVQKDNDLGRRVKAYMDRGKLVPDLLTIEMLVDRLQRPDALRGAIFDGYPRTVEQGRALDEALAKRGKTVSLALHVTASDDEIIRRLSGRWTCPNCGEIFHESSRPPKRAGVCDRCGGALAQRSDDAPEVVRERLARQRPPSELLALYADEGILVEVDGERDADEVERDLLATIEQRAPVAR